MKRPRVSAKNMHSKGACRLQLLSLSLSLVDWNAEVMLVSQEEGLKKEHVELVEEQQSFRERSDFISVSMRRFW